jgi:hypothetical protein
MQGAEDKAVAERKAAEDNAAAEKKAAEKKAAEEKAAEDKAAAEKKAEEEEAEGDEEAGEETAKVVVSAPWETRAIEIGLIIVGSLVLAFVGFVAAGWPTSFGSRGATTMKATGPVTEIGATSIGTTVTQVTTVAVKTTSSVSSSSTTTDTWLATILGTGALIVLAGAFYRRAAKVGGFGINISLAGQVSDPVKKEIAEAIADKDIPAEQVPYVYDRVVKKARKAQVRVVTRRQKRPEAKGFDRLKWDRLKKGPKEEVVVDVSDRKIDPQKIGRWVDQAKEDVSSEWGNPDFP